MRNRRPEETVLVLAPRGRDGVLARDLIEDEGIGADLCEDLPGFCEKLPAAGAGLITEEALVPHFDCLARALRDQPPWSDFPLVVFRGTDTEGAGHLLEMLEYLGNVTLLDRPVRKLNLATSLLAALRARRRQYQLRDLLADLEESVRQRDRFLAMLGHELRNPLAAITAAVELSRRRGPPSEEIGIIRRQTRHLSRLVDDLLDVSRVTSGKIVLERATIELADLAERCVQSLAVPARSQRIEISVEADRDVQVEGDPVRLEQIVTNVVTNAIKYTPPGGRVTVEVRREGDGALLSVRDTGAGIAPEVLPTIFNLFAQAQDTLDRAQGGMGIGLTLVRSLVALHGGTVEASSDGLGRGSEFRIFLPLAAADPAVSAAAAPGEEPLPKAPGRRIVLIEDNADLRESIRQLLELDGHTVATAADGPEGLERIRSVRPDVALIDIGLPRLDGYAVAAAARAELGGDLRLVALTGYGQAEDRERAARAGFDGHLTKPITGRALRRVIGEAAGSERRLADPSREAMS